MSMQIIARDGKIQRTNRAWEVLWGVTLDQIPDANLLADPQLEADAFHRNSSSCGRGVGRGSGAGRAGGEATPARPVPVRT